MHPATQHELEILHREMRACQRCLTNGYAVVPGAVMSGPISARIMTIGQAPGVTEVDAKRPFNASSGRRLFKWLGEAGFEETAFRSTQYMTSVTKCFPGKHPNGKGDRVPTKAEQKLCRPWLLNELMAVQPQVIIPIGGLAIKLFYPTRYRLKDIIGRAAFFPAGSWEHEPTFDIKHATLIDKLLDDDTGGRYVIPLPHPSGASLWPNKPENRFLIAQAIKLLAELREKWELL